VFTIAPPLNQTGSQAVLDILCQSKSHAVVMVSPRGLVESWNVGSVDLFGYSAESVIRSFSLADLHAADEQPLDDILSMAAHSGRWDGAVICVRSNGETIPVKLMVTPCFGPDEEIANFLFVYHGAAERVGESHKAQVSAYSAAAHQWEVDSQFLRLVELVEDYAIISLDADGLVASWNSNATRIEGFRPEQILGKHVRTLYLPADATDGKPERDLAAAAKRGARAEEGWRRRKDGTRFWASVIITALHDHAGNLTGYGYVVHDLTERRSAEQALRESNALLHAFLNHSPSIMFFKDPQGRYLEVNNRFLERFGFERADVIGKMDSEIFPSEQAAQFCANDLLAMKMGSVFECEEHADYIDGRHTSIVYKFPIPYGAKHNVALGGIVVDITERKRAEEENLRLNVELRERIKMLETFGYSVSHDLAAPLRAIRGFAEILSDRHAGALDEKGQHFLANILEASTQMSQLIEDLLAYSRLGRNPVKLQEVLPLALVHEAVRGLGRQVSDRSACIDIAEDEGPCWADVRLLSVAITHILDNAMKFHKPGQAPLIEVRLLCTEEDRLTLRISDNGIGIEPAYCDKIFAIFQRLHGTDEYPGTGIGLAMAEKAAALMGGKVWAESEPGIGSVFYLQLQRVPGQPVR
jgi:PAS domain S-box-containing protein